MRVKYGLVKDRAVDAGKMTGTFQTKIQ